MLAEYIENLLDGAALLAARIQLAVGVGACPTLAETVVALAVHLLRLGNLRQVALALVDILAALQHDGAQTQLYQSQGGKQSARSGTDDDDLRGLVDVGIVRHHVLVLGRLLVDVAAHLQVDEDGALAGVDATAQDAQRRQRAHVEAVLVGQEVAQRLLVGSHVGLHANLILVNHLPCGSKL